MSTSTVTVNGAQVPVDVPDRNLISITINQESSLAYLCKAVGQLWARQQKAASKSPQPLASASPSSTRICCGGEQKVLGGVQILLGIVCIGLGVVVDYESVFYTYLESGAAYWMGGLFVFSGAFSVVSGRRGGNWVHVATFFNLASVVAASVALTKGIASIPNLNYTFYEKSKMCKTSPDPFAPTSNPDYPSYDWKEEQCKFLLWRLLAVAYSVRIFLLIFSAAALAVALFCFGFGVRSFYRSLQARNNAYVEVEEQEVPPPYEGLGRPETSPEQPGACPV